MGQLISGVARIHEAGYIHRDLKPWNIILSDDHSQVKIIDFGLATPLDKEQRSHPFNTFMPGTKQYMSPENIVRPAGTAADDVINLSEADLSKVDTFALGVILINMLTGSYIFESCLTDEYLKLTSDSDYMLQVLRNKINLSEESKISEEELNDLCSLIQGMIHPDAFIRLSIEDLR